MESEKDILNELQQHSPMLAASRPATPYRVPQGYFDHLADAVWEKIRAEAVLPAVAEPIFAIPEGYFEGFAGNVMARIKAGAQVQDEIAAELAGIAPVLNTVSRNNVYTVPAGYFEQLQPVTRSAPAKVVGFSRTRRWMQYAAAAVVAGVLITSAFLFTDQSPYKKYSGMDVPGELQKITDNDLASYLYTPERVPAVSSQEILSDVKENIHGMSDEELSNYLSENPDAEMAIPVSN